MQELLRAHERQRQEGRLLQEAREELRGVSSQRRSDATTTQRLQDECKEWEDKARQAKAREEALAQELSAALQAKADVEQDTKALEDKLFLLQQRYSTEVSRLPSLILPGPAFFLVHARANSPLCILASLAAFLSGKASVLNW